MQNEMTRASATDSPPRASFFTSFLFLFGFWFSWRLSPQGFLTQELPVHVDAGRKLPCYTRVAGEGTGRAGERNRSVQLRHLFLISECCTEGKKVFSKGWERHRFFFFKSHAHTIRKLNQNLKNRQDSGQVAVNASRAAAPAPGGLRAWGPGCWREQPARPRGWRRSGGGGRAGGGAAPCELAERREAGSALVRFPLAPGASSRARLGNPRGNGKQD